MIQLRILSGETDGLSRGALKVITGVLIRGRQEGRWLQKRTKVTCRWGHEPKMRTASRSRKRQGNSPEGARPC